MDRPRPAFALALLLGLVGCGERGEVVVFHAASLSQPFTEVAEAYRELRPQTVVRLEPSGSLVAARKVAELGLRADLVAVADATILDRMLLPAKADFAVEIATNEIVLAHLDHSRFTDEVSGESWPEVLARPDVRLGCADPALAPIGYHTLVAWQLCDRSPGGDLVARLRARCPRDRLVPDETELVALLESRAVDYAFLYRSTAEDHRLKITALPASCNLSRRELAASYATASVDVAPAGAAPVRRAGAPIVYAVTIPRDAPHPDEARRFLAFLLGERGRAALARRGLAPLVPAPAHGAALPQEVGALVTWAGRDSPR